MPDVSPDNRGRRPADHARELVVGSLTWQIGQLGVGESLVKAHANETLRRTCLRAIANVVKRKPCRKYDMDLWLALHHTGTGESMRLYKIYRIR